MFHLLFLAAQYLSIKIVSQKAEKCNHIPRLFQITSHFSLILFFDMFYAIPLLVKQFIYFILASSSPIKQVITVYI